MESGRKIEGFILDLLVQQKFAIQVTCRFLSNQRIYLKVTNNSNNVHNSNTVVKEGYLCVFECL